MNRFCAKRSWACGFPADGVPVEQVQLVRAVLDAVAQYVDGAALGDLALEASQELPSCRSVLVQRERFGGLWLRGEQEARELDEIDAELALVVVGVVGDPADAAVGGGSLRYPARLRRITGMAGQRRADQPFEAALGGVGDHEPGCGTPGSIQPLVARTSAAKPICLTENCFFRAFQP